MNKILLAKLLVCLAFYTQAQNTISGYVKDASNGETLIGATVLIKGSSQGVITNVYGFYSITLPQDVYEVEYRYIGYQPIAQSVDLSENRRIDVELFSDSQQLEEVVISAEPEDVNVSGIQMSSNKLDIETITKIPSFMGEADVLRSIQMVPGVATVGEGASGFNVRGGSVGQNMVLLDEAPVYNSSHMLGFFSVFNPDAVKDVNLIKGGIPARYGGRISSVLDIRMKEGNSKEFAAQGGIGTIFSRVAVEAPIVKDKASFIIAARRSYIDVFAKAFTDALDGGAALNFYDLTMKTNWNINEKNRVYLSGYFGRDNFKFDANQGFNWGNKTATLRWNHIFTDRIFANFTAFFSDYDYVLAFGEDEMDQFDWNSRILNYDFKPEFTYFVNPNNEVSFGGELLFLKFEPANAVGVSNGESQDISLPSKNALESALYISNDQKIGQSIQLQYGLRYSHFSLLGSGVAYTYGDTIPGTRRPVIGAEEFDSRESIQSYDNFEPRFSVKYQLNKYNSFKASYNKTSQYLHLISNTTASNPLDVWTPSSNNIKPQIGHQVALGWFRNFGPDNNVEFSAEVYYRKTENQIDYIDGADLLINEYIEGDLLSGEGRAYGLELYAKKNTGRLTGWVSYTLAKTELQTEGINRGRWYPTRYDQRHNVKLAAFYDLNDRWSLSTNFTFLTGTPTTFPTSRYQMGDYVVPYNYGDGRNNFRIPVYHRLDISATLQGKRFRRNGERRKNESYWVFSVYNLYGRKNPFSIYFTQDNDVRPGPGDLVDTQARQVSIIGNMIPAVSYNFKF
ncbi:MAG: TonB-dependent receptor [Reichenbachiella sp.]|uniref:TonB-dependent receptor n=1 Tax=Reichenbachiella sp. TaxID=2184521 RepID=UPI0029675ECB|nr:TonB-dependent receptor [Reichenbachiella sp.]MDW3208525.1 TonB-dependent receptor [Reichenbachiella sp.]